MRELLCGRGERATDIIAEWSREQIEEEGYELLLCAIGDERCDPRTDRELPPLSDGVWHFDFEAVEDTEPYAHIAERCSALTGGDLVFDRVEDIVDHDSGVAWVELTRGGKTRHVDLKINDDWADEAIFSVLQEELASTGSKRKFYIRNLGQDVLVVCCTDEAAQALGSATGLRFKLVR